MGSETGLYTYRTTNCNTTKHFRKKGYIVTSTPSLILISASQYPTIDACMTYMHTYICMHICHTYVYIHTCGFHVVMGENNCTLIPFPYLQLQQFVHHVQYGNLHMKLLECINEIHSCLSMSTNGVVCCLHPLLKFCPLAFQYLHKTTLYICYCTSFKFGFCPP